MKKFILDSILIIIIILSAISCYEPPTQPEFEERIIISAYVYVGRGIDSVFVSRSLPVGTQYAYPAAAVSEAEVRISVDNRHYQLIEYNDMPGCYFLPEDSLLIREGRTYRLEVITGKHKLAAETTAPGPVRITSLNTQISYYLGQQFQIGWTAASGAEGYLLTTLAKPPYTDRVDIEGFIDSEDVDEDSLEAFSPVMNFALGSKDTELQIPWFMFWYYGEYTIKIYAGDQNLYDLSTSSVIFAGQSSEYEQPTFNVNGGLGIFSAVSVDSQKVFVLPYSEEP